MTTMPKIPSCATKLSGSGKAVRGSAKSGILLYLPLFAAVVSILGAAGIFLISSGGRRNSTSMTGRQLGVMNLQQYTTTRGGATTLRKGNQPPSSSSSPLVGQNQSQTPTVTTAATRATANSASANDDKGSSTKTTKFVFMVGIAGTGHHMYEEVVSNSPAFLAVKKASLRKDLERLSLFLFNHENKALGLWSAVCSPTGPNLPMVFDRLVSNLKRLSANVEDINRAPSRLHDPIPAVPLNAVYGIRYFSYPMESGYHPCSILQTPDLNALFAACDAANVECEIVVGYRDPYEVVKSTTMNRKFGSKREYIPTLTLMLERIRAQILDHPHRVSACFDYNMPSEFAHMARRTFGWDSDDEFNEFFAGVYNQHPPLTEEQRLDVVKPELQLNMDSMMRATESLRQTCRDALARSSKVEAQQ